MRLGDIFEIVIKLQPKIELISSKIKIDNLEELIKQADKEFGFIDINQKEYVYFKKGRYLIFDILPSLKKELEECKRKTLFDGLTGCMTKIETEHILDRMLKTYLRYKDTPFSIITFDIDYFKKINDTYGHLAGDYILKELSNIVKSQLRDADICGRVGGEEFLIILPNTKISGALKLAQRIRKQIQNHKFIYNDQQIPVTISLGLTSVSITDSFESLLSRADEALYDAKHKGRNRVEYR